MKPSLCNSGNPWTGLGWFEYDRRGAPPTDGGAGARRSPDEELRVLRDPTDRLGLPIRTCLLWAALAGLLSPAFGAEGRPSLRERLKQYPSKYYVVYSDLDADVVREASARMTAMAEEYHRRTRGFAGVIRSRLPFYLFSDPEDYYKAGGIKGSAGVYVPGRNALMALASHGADSRLWKVVQHEGFHQFVGMVIGGQIPAWVNEGLAEYFGEGIWTGDGFLVGVVPPYRLRSLQGYLRDGRTVPFRRMLTMTYPQWSEIVKEKDPNDPAADPGGTGAGGEEDDEPTPTSGVIYAQAWSMVHFLVHADEGKYRKAFSAMIHDISRGADRETAFTRHIGRNVEAFEQRYKDWWLAQPENPSGELYVQAVVQTLTSFLARAVAQKQKFATAEEFFRAARAETLKSHRSQWLPPSLLNQALLHARKWRSSWLLRKDDKYPQLVLQWGRTKTYVGAYTCARGLAKDVKVTVAETPAEPPKK